jgi:hypothetical protein
VIDQALRDEMKAATRASPYYDSNRYAAESNNKLTDELRIGANVVIMANKCPTLEDFQQLVVEFAHQARCSPIVHLGKSSLHLRAH